MKKKVLLLTQWFDPEPTFKGLVFAKELIKQGFDVEVVTGFPNYPSGKIYDGYHIKLIQRETIDGVQVTRVPLYPSHDSSALKRVFNYLSFALSALCYCLFFAKRADVMYVYHPPLTTGIVAAIVRFFRRVPVVYDVQDMWPDTLKATGMISNERALNIIGGVANWVYKRVDKIVVLSPGFKKLLISRQVDDSKINVIPNWCAENSIKTGLNNKIPEGMLGKGYFKVLFAGNLGKAQALDTVIQAAGNIGQQYPGVAFVFLGAGVELNQLKQKAAEYKNIYFIPQVPMEKVGEYLNEADVLLVHLKDDPLFEITIPSKTQAYMAAGKPIIMGVKGDAADIINNANCGIVIEPENSAELVDAVIHLQSLNNGALSELGQRAFDYYQSNLSLEIGVQSFANIFNNVVYLNDKA
jgi:colanic acid biosynthesis glycosyl transferase WcaI